jgi:hypothetical protein
MLELLIAYGPSIIAAIHIVRTGRPYFWLFICLLVPGIGPLVYLIVEVLPELFRGPTARRMGKAAGAALDPERDYRAAKLALTETETVGNKVRLAQAAAGLDRWAEAEPLWRDSLTGPFADDPVVLLGHANALIELERYDEALAQLDKLAAVNAAETGPAALAFARAYEGAGRLAEAEAPYRFAADKVPGLQAGARYVAYLAKIGRMDDARTGFAEIERRFAKIASTLQKHERPWRDLAARAVGR